jgi:DNA-binding NarL/FixJ family response regulator
MESTPEVATQAAVAGVEADRQINTSEGTHSEASVAAEPATPKADEKPLSSEYAILARKEKQLRARDQQLRQRELAIKAAEDAKNAPLQAAKPSFDESKYISKDKLQNDLFGTLSELGLSYDQITQQAVNAPTPEQIQYQQDMKALREELKALKGEQETVKKTWEEQQTESYKQAVNQIKNEAMTLIKHDPNFETIRETDSVNDVVELIERTFKEDGVLLTVEEASTQVEDYLVEEALKIARIKKIQQRLQPAAAKPALAPQKNTVPQQQQMKTLTNQVSSTRKLTSRERAILAAEGKLNKQ